MRAVAVELEATFLAEMLKASGLGKARDAFGGGAGEEQFSSFLVRQQADQLALQTMIADLGLQESAIASRDLPGWSAPKKVVAWVDSPERLAGLQEAAPGVEIVLVENEAQAATEIADAQVLMGMCSTELLENAAEIHWVQVYSSGVEWCVPARLFPSRKRCPRPHRQTIIETQ